MGPRTNHTLSRIGQFSSEILHKHENQAPEENHVRGWQNNTSAPEKISFQNGKTYQLGQIYHQDEISKFGAGAGTVPIGYCWRMISRSSSNMVLEKDHDYHGADYYYSRGHGHDYDYSRGHGHDYDYSRGHGHGHDYDDYDEFADEW